MQRDYDIVDIEMPSLVKESGKAALERWAGMLPEDRSARILLKPNFNSNFNALTGNTTDMRLLAAVIEFLQGKGYSNLVLGEGTSSGFVREGISVIHRLRADRLAAQYGVEIMDLNAWPQSVDVPLENGVVVQVADLLAESDFLNISCPLNKETRRLIGEKELDKMKKTAYLVNAARGPIVDESALIRALQEGRIRGAGLDVFEQEPTPIDNPLLKMENVVVAPHSLCETDELFMGMWEQKERQLSQIVRGEVPEALVNREVWDKPGFQSKLKKFRESIQK